MNCYEIQVRIEGTITIEDPHGPSEWRGSGCYTTDCYCWQDVNVTLPAESEDAARKAVEAYDFSGDPLCDVEDIREVMIKSIELIGEDDDDDTIETCWGSIESCEDDGPDPDDYYEERRLREME